MEKEQKEGALLAEYLVSNHLSKQELCKRLGITRQILAYHLRRQFLSRKFKGMLSEAGIDIFENKQHYEQFLQDQNKQLKERISMLNGVIILQKQFIKHVTKKCKHGVCLNFILDKEGVKN
jgi:hypothetical protein